MLGSLCGVKQMHKLPFAPLVREAWRQWGTMAGSREGPGSGEVKLSTRAEMATLRHCYWTHACPDDG